MRNISLLFLLAFSIPSLAQQEKNDHFIPQPALIIGGSFQKFDGLNSRIANLPQYKQLPNYTATLELGWLKERNRLISGAGFSAGSSMSGNHDKKSSAIHSLGVHADIGYNVLKSKRVMLYPLAGIGYEMYKARFFKDNSGVDFNDVLQSPTAQNNINPVDFKNSFFTYRIGFGISVKSSKYPSNSIGLQAGYTGSFSSHTWRSNEDQVLLNAPEDKLSKIYFGLVLICNPWMMMKEMH